MSLDIISASAGTGKTYTLCERIVAALRAPPAERVRVEGLLAITYTRKADAELRTRIRRRLIACGMTAEAQQLPLAYCGTVHAVCLRLITEHALQVGLPPALDVLSEDGADVELARALELALTPEAQADFDAVCERLRPRLDWRTQRHNWLLDAQDLLELARSNGVERDRLIAMGHRSADALLALLPPALPDFATLDARLLGAIVEAIAAFEQRDDAQKSDKTLGTLRDMRRKLDAGNGLAWSDWLALTKLSPAAATRPLVTAVVERAKDHERHPRFHADLRTYVTTIFEIVARGLEEYGRWKAERRLVDYVDMEERVLRLLDDAEVTQRLRDQLDLVVIDEFQDTSPIQLALFRRLQTLAKQSIWVGDRKQSIFAFRGADPELMERTIDHAHQAGRTISRLSVNYRSRQSLVAFVSELFTPAFARHGYVADDVRVTSHRGDEPIGALSPLGCWWLEAKTQAQEAAAIARGVVRLLAHPADSPVVRPDTKSARPAKAGDIAILAATNAETRRIADALAAAGVRSVVARAGLLRTPEGTTLHAALRRVVDRHDHAAAAELEALSDFDGRSPDEWLAEHMAAPAEGKRRESRGFAGLIDARRDEIVLLSPVEAVERLIALLDLASVCRRWPRSAQSLSNLDAFSALARRYEDHCSHVREAVSLPGFLQFLVSRAKAEDDAQLAVSDDAVHVCTYHRAKGLEWPIVVLAGLDTKSRAYGVTPDAATARLERGLHHRVFAASAESDQSELQPEAPLAGRWLRLWPWPYASHQDAPLSRRAADTDEARRVGEGERRESLRLLYVGFTRARDHLVLTARRDPKSDAIKAAWLESIDDGRGPLLALPTAEGERQPIAVGRKGWQCAARVWRLDGAADAPALPSLATGPIDFAPAETSRRDRPPYRIAPARAEREWLALPKAVVTRKARLGDRVSFAVPERDLAQAGTAVHEFLATDDSTHSTGRRVDLARRLLQRRAVDRIDAEQLVAAADAFRVFVDREWPNAIWHREMPIAAALSSPSGRQALEGRIDLLLETTAGWVLVDHKSYPGGESTWEARALEHAPQLAAYRQALLMSGSLPVIASVVHFTIAGGVIILGFA